MCEAMLMWIGGYWSLFAICCAHAYNSWGHIFTPLGGSAYILLLSVGLRWSVYGAMLIWSQILLDLFVGAVLWIPLAVSVTPPPSSCFVSGLWNSWWEEAGQQRVSSPCCCTFVVIATIWRCNGACVCVCVCVICCWYLS